VIEREILQKKFRIFILLSSFVLLMEVAGGIFTNSLALLSDAGHVLIDLLALLLAYFAIRLSKRGPTKRFTFGYYRAEILSAIINGLLLMIVTIFIFYESYSRFVHPQPILGPQMLAISMAGLLANMWVVVKMQGYGKENINIRGAYLHVLSDTISSIGVVIAGVLIIMTGNYIFDPLMSAIIGFFIVLGSLGLIRQSVGVLMEAAPKGIDLERLSDDMHGIRGVREVHDIHAWSISSDVYALTSHVIIDAKNVRSMNKIVSDINRMLKEKYGITHTAIQSECERCVDAKKKHRH